MRTVSIVIPAYNQGHYLDAAIRSALGQTHRDIEVVVVDDGSTDHTREVAAGFSDPRVKYVYQENRGLAAARNTGIRESRGAYLTFLDSDDLFLPEKVEVLLGAFAARPDLGLTAGQAVLIGEQGERLGEVFEDAPPTSATDWLLGNPLHVGSVLLRREWQERVGLFDERLRSYEDWDLWLRLARAGCPMGWVARPVSLYRFHGAQMTRIGAQMTRATFAVLDKTFDDPQLSPEWRARQGEAYSRGHLRAAAQAYTAEAFENAVENMRQAVTLDPALAADDGALIAGIVAGWANHVKTRDPLAFMARIYANLPVELAALGRHRRDALGAEALQLAFAAHQRGEFRAARRYAGQALAYRPKAIFNRGVLSILVRAPFSDSLDAATPGASPRSRWTRESERAASRGNS
jgi:glycosyltransferase involved in cell wall biosynthesis